jgi:type VI secretion system protein ImpL
MKAILAFLTQKMVVQLVGLFALCSLIWFAGPLISFAHRAPLESEFNRLLAILLVVIAWAVYNLFLQAKNQKRDRQLMTELSTPSLSPERAAIEDAQKEEIAALQSRFEEALHLLKSTQWKGRANRQYVYELPWYVIIGGPGVGKTTLLLNSGLKFPLAERLGHGPVKGVGGTRNCDWFFSEEAIFLDTAGRYVTQDSYQPVDKAAWAHFLGLLKKYRGRRPINGVFLAMSISELMEQSEEERRRHTRELRQRLMELYDVLGNRFPVYMMFTKCDLIAGFTDFFANLTQEERAQVFGETFPNQAIRQLESHLGRFSVNYDELLRRLNQWVLRRMQDERDIRRRGLVMFFPQQLAMLKPNLLAFLSEIFVTSRFEMEPLLRGVYFTSATQEGTPIDRVMSVMAGAYGMDRQNLPVFSGKGKSFFITRLLREVIFPEAELAGVDPRVERRHRWLYLMAYSALGIASVGMIALWMHSYYLNKQALDQVEQKVEAYRAAAGRATGSDATLRTTVAHLNALQDAHNIYQGRHWPMRFGLYQGEKVQAGIKEVYEQRLVDSLLPEIEQRLRLRMGETLQRRAPDDLGGLYELLRVYLMLGLPEKMDSKLAGVSIGKCWKLDFSREPQLQDQLAAHTDQALKVLVKLEKTVPLDQAVIDDARRRLKAIPIAQQIYTHLRSEALSDHSNDFRLVDAIPPASDAVFITADSQPLQTLSIPGLFTYSGYESLFKKMGLELVRQTLKENWVLDQYVDESGNLESLKRLYDDVEKQYFAEYKLHWSNLLNNLKVKKPKGIYETIQILDQLAGPETPLRPLLQAVEKNTRFTKVQEAQPAEGAATGAAKESPGVEPGSPLATQATQSEMPSRPAREMESYFQPLQRLVQGSAKAAPPLEVVLQRLNEVRDVMMQVTSGARTEEQALKLVKERMKGMGATDVVKKANMEFAHLPEPLREWLLSLTSFGWELTMNLAISELNNIWKTEVLAPYMEGLHGRYPLFQSSRKEVTMADFSSFFAPKGTIDKFFETYLKAFVDTTAAEWRQAATESGAMRLSANVLHQFQVAAKIRDAFFGAGEATPSVQFQLKPLELDANVTAFRISIDGQTEEYAHGPVLPSTFQWPGPHGKMGVVMTFWTLDGKVISQGEEGPWGWLRTLDKADFRPTALRDRFLVTFQVDGYKARYELQAKSVSNPFGLVELQQFRCPESL